MARHMRWIDSLVGISVASGAQGQVDLTVTLEDNERRGLTLTRTLLHLWFSDNDVVETAVGHQGVDYAGAIIDADALAANVFPDPESATDFPPTPWTFRDRVHVRSSTLALLAGNIFPDVHMDLRSQRKLGNGRHVLIITNTAVTGVAFTVRVRGIIRQGFLLP